MNVVVLHLVVTLKKMEKGSASFFLWGGFVCLPPTPSLRRRPQADHVRNERNSLSINMSAVASKK